MVKVGYTYSGRNIELEDIGRNICSEAHIGVDVYTL